MPDGPKAWSRCETHSDRHPATPPPPIYWKWGLEVLAHNCPRLPTIVVILRRKFPLGGGPKGTIVDDRAQIAESGPKLPFESPHFFILLDFPECAVPRAPNHKFPDLPRGQPLSPGSLTPSDDSQRVPPNKAQTALTSLTLLSFVFWIPLLSSLCDFPCFLRRSCLLFQGFK